MSQNPSEQLFYETRTKSKPRSLFVNFHHDVGPTPWSMTQLDDPEDAKKAVFEEEPLQQQVGQHEQSENEEFEDINLIKNPKKPQLSNFHQNSDDDVDGQVKLFNAWNKDHSTRKIREFRQNYDLPDRFYTDFQEIEHDYHILNYKLSNYDQLYYKFYSNQEVEDTTDFISQQLERSDYTEAFQLFQNSQTHFSLFNTEILNFIQEECPRASILLYDVQPSYQVKFPLQMQINSILQQIDFDNTHQLVQKYSFQPQLYLQSAQTAVNAASLFQATYSMQFIQNKLIDTPLRKYIQNCSFLEDAFQNRQIDQVSQQIKASFAAVQVFRQTKESKLDQFLVEEAKVESFVAQLQHSVQNQQTSLNTDIILQNNQQYEEMLQIGKSVKRSLQIHDSEIKLSKTFPHMFQSEFKYRTDANLCLELFNSPVIQNDMIQLKREMKKRKTNGKYAKYFQKVDREDEEVFDYIQSVVQNYDGKWWEGKIEETEDSD